MEDHELRKILEGVAEATLEMWLRERLRWMRSHKLLICTVMRPSKALCERSRWWVKREGERQPVSWLPKRGEVAEHLEVSKRVKPELAAEGESVKDGGSYISGVFVADTRS
ncbi:hypothetical protein S245_052329 [Arachis hypogaea]|nr:uncharacterized protein DS421_15g505950 [Arachis hypogaea]